MARVCRRGTSTNSCHCKMNHFGKSACTWDCNLGAQTNLKWPVKSWAQIKSLWPKTFEYFPFVPPSIVEHIIWIPWCTCHVLHNDLLCYGTCSVSHCFFATLSFCLERANALKHFARVELAPPTVADFVVAKKQIAEGFNALLNHGGQITMKVIFWKIFLRPWDIVERVLSICF